MPKITEMFAFVAEEVPGDEGVMGFKNHRGEWMPMVGADMERVSSLIPMADEIAKILNLKYRILKFELVGQINPDEVRGGTDDRGRTEGFHA